MPLTAIKSKMAVVLSVRFVVDNLQRLDKLNINKVHFGACKMRSRLPFRLQQFARGMALWKSSGYIGGNWKDCDAKFPVYNPATGQELGKVADMGRKDAEESVKQAYDAFKVWKNVTTKVLN